MGRPTRARCFSPAAPLFFPHTYPTAPSPHPHDGKARPRPGPGENPALLMCQLQVNGTCEPSTALGPGAWAQKYLLTPYESIHAHPRPTAFHSRSCRAGSPDSAPVRLSQLAGSIVPASLSHHHQQTTSTGILGLLFLASALLSSIPTASVHLVSPLTTCLSDLLSFVDRHPPSSG
jgi:hypothetical protein